MLFLHPSRRHRGLSRKGAALAGLTTVMMTALLSAEPGLADDAAHADTHPPANDHVVILLQSDKSMLSRTEARGPLETHFDEIDTNKDGKLSRDEIDAWFSTHHPDGPPPHCHVMKMGASPPNPFESMDKNHDGKVSRDEFTDAMLAHFDKLDANHDGFISADEMPHPKMIHREVRIEKHVDGTGHTKEIVSETGGDGPDGCQPPPMDGMPLPPPPPPPEAPAAPK